MINDKLFYEGKESHETQAGWVHVALNIFKLFLHSQKEIKSESRSQGAGGHLMSCSNKNGK